MHKFRYFLMLAIFILAIGCYLLLGGDSIKQTDWPMYLGAVCLIVAVCVAALIQAIQALHLRIQELEKKQSDKQ